MRDREFKFRPSDFKAIRDIVYDRAGITLADNKHEMVYSRISRRLRTLEIVDFKSYLAFLASKEGEDEVNDFTNAMTTNLTKFFRESHHFTHMRNDVLQAKVQSNRMGIGHKKIRIWSAGCSSGMEPYSIAMTVKASLPKREKWDVRILATDIDTNMLDVGKSGIYRTKDAAGIPDSLADRFVSEEGPNTIMADEIRSMISFKYMNFMEHPWPIKNKFDVIFCRNVMIYFDAETQERIVKSFVEYLEPGGVLYVGHAEALVAKFCNLISVGRSTYMVGEDISPNLSGVLSA